MNILLKKAILDCHVNVSINVYILSFNFKVYTIYKFY